MDWFRMYTEARNDAKLRVLTDSQHRVWFNLLCFASEQKENRGSLIDYEMDLLSIEVSNGDIDLLSETIQRLQKLRIISVNDDTITFLNFSKRQYDKPSDKPEATRERKRQQRERDKQSHANVTPSHATDTDTDTDTKKDNSPLPPKGECKKKPFGFDLFWTHYPKKRSKGQAEKAWNKINPDEQLQEAILQALERAKTSVDWTKEGGRFIQYPATWLNAKGWEDEYSEVNSYGRSYPPKDDLSEFIIQ